ncbi:MAG TPA: PRC-barrel domain-containing protein [Chloroflexia bacterium]|nr:PRC-barrel domain-containing protein [Chloroflexia bacterium]
MKASNLKGLAVLNLGSAEKVGTIHDVWLDLTTGRITAFDVKKVKGNEVFHIDARQVQNLGADALTYRDMNSAAPGTVSALQAQPQTGTMSASGASAYVQQGNTFPTGGTQHLNVATGPAIVALSRFVNHEKIVSDAGNLLGIVKEVMIDPANLSVTEYEVSEGGLFGKTHTIPAGPGIKFGPEIGIVPDNQLNQGGHQHA